MQQNKRVFICQPCLGWFVCFILLLSSCTVGPDYKTPHYPLPKRFTTTIKQNQRPIAHGFWWHACSDRILVSLIDQALIDGNLDIRAGYKKIRAARAQLNIAKADFFPSVNLDGKVSRDRLSGNSEILSAFPQGSIPLLYTNYKAGFDATWELDFFGHTRRQVEAAQRDLESMIANQNNVVIATAAEVAKDYTLYRVYQERIKITRDTIALYAKTLHLVKLRYAVGEATAIDVARVQSDLLSAKASIPSLQAEARATVVALAVLTGDFPEQLIVRLARSEPIPQFKTNQLHIGIPANVLLRRPDVQQAERNLAAATARIGVAKADLFPRVQLVGDLGFDTTIPGTYFQKVSQYWSIGPHISLPIFQGNRLINAVNAQEAARDSAEAEYKKAILNALADVEASLIRYQSERQRQAKLYASYHKLESVLRLTQLRYRSGQISLTEVLDVMRQLNDMHEQYAQANGNVTINLVSIYKALGGSWLQADL
ncbi:MAG: efflux transporter outer membrane subunit [Gammaproteobacteria bacterium]|nr:efflux transporter outer membrane subunit [Gammaproteobacteria bacterium]MCW5584340.1 efflux transporter outer membrane subunit [Gammaproteobacteria bacterium]